MKPSQVEMPLVRLSVRLTPRASSNAVLRYEDGVLFLRLTAPLIEGAANAACCAYVACRSSFRSLDAVQQNPQKT